jgi:hypothetical protein
MANELEIADSHPPISVIFSIVNAAASSTVDGTLAQGTAGFVVPTGYEFHALALSSYINDSITAGLLTIKVTDDGTELVNGPEIAMTSAADFGAGVKQLGAQPIAAGSVVGVSGTGDASLAPDGTADLDVVLLGALVPA